jgi:DNA-binding LacI/PurR family transcriptional regulator
MEAAHQIITLPDSERPDAVFAANDMVALGAMTTFLRSGIRVPETSHSSASTTSPRPTTPSSHSPA